jgi:peptide/nickel transport system substrate-binding protein
MGGGSIRPVSARLGLLGLVLSLVLAACGSDGSGDAGREGGRIKISHLAFPDYLDPALSYTLDGWQALSLVYPGLLTFPHDRSGAASAEPLPALAEALPKISADGRTYELRLRKGLEFADGTPLKASDFKASVERILAMDSQGAGLGYTNIVGGEQFVKTKRGGVRGIEVDDATGGITIRLVKPRGPFLYELAIPFAGVVPAGTPTKNQTNDPPPGAGRYRFVDVDAPHGYSLVRNDNFSKPLRGTAVDAGKVDRIDAVVESASNAATDVSRGKLDFMVDDPPPDRLPEIRKRYPDRYREFPTPSTYYFFLNTAAPPFDKLAVRQAANYVIDPEAISRIMGGVITPAHTVLPPEVPGYPDGEDLYPTNMEKAKALIEKAGAKGASVKVWTDAEPSVKTTVEYYADQLSQAGLDAKPKVVPSETYFATIGDRSLKPQTGFTNFFQDYPHPANFLDTLVNPNNVVATGNNNLAYNAGDKRLARMIEDLNQEPVLTDEVKRRWGEVDRYVQEHALMAIYGNREQATFFSERMDFEHCRGDEHAVYGHDWHAFCLK